MKTTYLNNFAAKSLLITALFSLQAVYAETFTIDKNSDIVGEVKYVTAKKGDTLYTIGRENDLGLLEMQEANPKISPDKSIKAGTKITVPSQFILPPGDRSGLVINLPELRVYYYSPDQTTVTTHPIGIGKVGWRTPIGETTIVQKRENPTWTPPPSIRAEAESRGIELPEVYGAGPRNPLGDYAMSLGWNGYELHGTNAPPSVGTRSSHGCMRMYPEDIKDLFSKVDVGTTVRVVYEPFKLGVKDGDLYLEAHELFTDGYYNKQHQDRLDKLQAAVNNVNYQKGEKINWQEAKELVHETNGYPVNITDATSMTTGTTTSTITNTTTATSN